MIKAEYLRIGDLVRVRKMKFCRFTIPEDIAYKVTQIISKDLLIKDITMRVRILKTRIPVGIVKEECICFIVKYKRHWWQRWHYIMDKSTPRLFFSVWEIRDVLKQMGYEKIDHYKIYPKDNSACKI